MATDFGRIDMWICRWCGQKWPAFTDYDAIVKLRMAERIHPLSFSCMPTDDTEDVFVKLYPTREMRCSYP